ncbi:hypothetical protein OnM2_073011 [Erysiphe neolycopersici]|uniref:Uncharacterized protein n=1 Tax=Erysiphe neolycopersici TaxID=212602 RepID=A0A420HJ75_9PEZI|nr:hypothetical protein OnM2_073011 [Erysiphe neolycopersici]
MRIIFSLTLTAIKAPLMNAIKLFIDSYLIDDAHFKISPQYLEIISQRTHLYAKRKHTTKAGKDLILKISKDSKTCGDYFGLNYQTINLQSFNGLRDLWPGTEGPGLLLLALSLAVTLQGS